MSTFLADLHRNFLESLRKLLNYFSGISEKHLEASAEIIVFGLITYFQRQFTNMLFHYLLIIFIWYTNHLIASGCIYK